MPELSATLFEVAGGQHGVVTTGQLRLAGLTGDQIARQPWLHRVHHGVYAVGHRPRTWQSRWMAAILAGGPGAVLSHADAAALWRLGPRPPGAVHVTVGATNGRRPGAGLAIHRSRRLPAEETTRHLGIPVTTPARTLLDLAPRCSHRRLVRAVDEAERLGLCDPDSLRRLLTTHHGRPGTRSLGAVLADHDDSSLTRSELEAVFLRLCRREGLPRPQVNAPLLDYVVDFLWPPAALIVETDGHESHRTRRAFQDDRTRDARLTAAGYRTLRFTYLDVTTRPPVVASRIRSSLRLAAAPTSPAG